MKYLLCSILLVFCVPTIHADSSPLDVSNIAPELLKNAHTVVRLDRCSFRVHSTKKTTESYKYIVTILNENSPHEELFVHYDEMKKVKKIEAQIYDEEGNFIRKNKKNEVRDVSAPGASLYTDNRGKYISVNHGTYPYTIIYTYEIEKHSSPFYPRWIIQDYQTSVERAQFEITYPKDIPVRHQLLNISQEPLVLNTAEEVTLNWTFTDLPAIIPEAYSPTRAEVLPYLYLAPTKFQLGKYKGDMTSWENYGMFYHLLNEEADNMSAEMVATVRDLTKDAITEAEKIDILYRYLQQNMRYVSVQLGVGGWQSYDAQYVEKNKFGDCKALTFFMKSMLDKVGVTAYPALVKAGRDQFFEMNDDFPIPLFTHVILHIPAEDTWLECTSKNLPTNYLSDFTADRNVLLITERGGKKIRTPAYVEDHNKSTRFTQISIDQNGNAIIKNTSHLFGPKQDRLRLYDARLSDETIRELFQKHNSTLPSSFKIRAFDLQISDTGPEAVLDYKLEVPRYASKAGRRLFVPINCLNNIETAPPANSTRKQEIVLRDAFIEVDTIILEFPEGYEVESMPDEVIQIDASFGTYQLKLRKDGRKIWCQRSLSVQATRLPKEAYNDFRSFYIDALKADKTKIVLVKKKT